MQRYGPRGAAPRPAAEPPWPAAELPWPLADRRGIAQRSVRERPLQVSRGPGDPGAPRAAPSAAVRAAVRVPEATAPAAARAPVALTRAAPTAPFVRRHAPAEVARAAPTAPSARRHVPADVARAAPTASSARRHALGDVAPSAVRAHAVPAAARRRVPVVAAVAPAPAHVAAPTALDAGFAAGRSPVVAAGSIPAGAVGGRVVRSAAEDLPASAAEFDPVAAPHDESEVARPFGYGARHAELSVGALRPSVPREKASGAEQHAEPEQRFLDRPVVVLPVLALAREAQKQQQLCVARSAACPRSLASL